MILSAKAKNIVMILVTLSMVALLLGLAEAGVRFRQWLLYGSLGHFEKSYETDPKTGLRVPIAGLKTGNISINSLGFRGPEIEMPKPSGRIRIAFLGASTTYCAEVSSNDMVWPDLVAKILKKDYPDIDYINGGVPGYDVSASIENLQTRIKSLNPDIIVIYHATNDLSKEVRELAELQEIHVPDISEENDWLSKKSLLWYLAKKNLKLRQYESRVLENQNRVNLTMDRLGGTFRTNLAKLIEMSKNVAPVVAIATFSYQVREDQSEEKQLKAANSALYYMPTMTPELLIRAFEKYNDIIRQLADKTQILLISGEMDIPGDSKYFNDTVHFKDPGSVLMAQRVSRTLSQSPLFERLLSEKTRCLDNLTCEKR